MHTEQLSALWLIYLNGRNMRKSARERVFGGSANPAAEKFLRFAKKDAFKPGGARALPSGQGPAKEVQLELFDVRR